ncbi:MAG TPA: PDZ domain-containing protein [Clostridiaceae bacterium]|nr:PDZ domain-containing protein [Clostridiaceae bacterium]
MRKGKVYIALFIIAIILMASFSSAAVAESKTSPWIIVNGRQVEQQAKIIDDKAYVPLEALGAYTGISAEWNKDSNVINIESIDKSSEVVKKLSPSVVGIIGKLKESSQYYIPQSDNLTFGTGVVYKSNGFIITNAHVVADMESIVVVLHNGRSYRARLKAIDEVSDLALIKIDKGGLTPVKFGKIEDVEVGEQVIAIGTPLSFSLRNSATSGIVSGINRAADGEYRFIQSDAAINGGNSGGPLVNMKGEVIGINTVKYVGFGVEGLSFSIPVDTVEYVMEHFEKYSRVRRPYLGATFIEGIAARYGLPSNEGLTVVDIENGSPAEAAGLVLDDVIESVNGVKITTKIDYNEAMKKYLPGDTVEFGVIRGGKSINLKVTFTEQE